MMVYAAKSKISVERTRGEIERLVRKYGAKGFASAWQEQSARVEFLCSGRHIRLTVSVPENEARAREKWRAMLLLVKAKLVAVDAKIASFEEAFFADIVMPETGKTVYEMARDPVRLSYETRKDQPLLGAPR
jgi:hypothetical protein